MSNFTHLHVHTMYSLLDGACRIEDLVQKAKDLGHTSLAITDHGTMFGIYHFYKECKKQGIKPIIGCEFYFHDLDDTYHLCLWASNQEGLMNLYRLQELAHTDGFHGKPGVTRRMLEKYNNGLICGTACIAGPIGQKVLHNQNPYEIINWFKTVFGPDFYLELQDNQMPEQYQINKDLILLSHKYSVPLIVTTDVHYTNQEDSYAHEVLLALQTQKKMTDEKRFRFSSDGFYLKSKADVLKNLTYLDSSILETAFENTNRIAFQCDVKLKTGQNLLPDYEPPGDRTQEQYLLDLCYQKLDLYRGLPKFEEYEKRLKYEYEVIKEKGYVGYFLIVWDYVKWAKSKGILVGPGRGSAGGSLIAYLLDITTVDPIKYGLLFERFLNPDRMSAPDIDVDFQYDRRQEVIEYLINKYEWNHVAQIMAIGSMTAKAVVRKVFSAFNHSQKEINKITGLIPDLLGVTIDVALKNPEFHKEMLRNPREFEVIQRLENVVDHAGRHAAGVVITPGPLSNYIPVYKLKNEATLITQWEKKIIEEIGVYKFDLLGLKTLSIIADAVKMIKENKGIDIDPFVLAETDQKTYDFLCNEDLDGIFQFDGDSGKRAVKAVQPKTFDDVMACEAICRPGVKEADLYVHNKQADNNTWCRKIEILPLEIAEILQDTSGAIVYQEQVMMIVHKMAGWSLGKADKLRKVKDLETVREEFVRDCEKHGYPSDLSNSIFNRFDMGYTFNKSHACVYAKISMATTYLKANYYIYFMTALMNRWAGDSNGGTEKIAQYITEVRKHNIEVVPPDINKSERKFTVRDGKIYFALSSIAGVGDRALEEIEKYKPYSNLQDMLSKCSNRIVNKRVVEALIKSGCFDFLTNRRMMMIQYKIYRGDKDEVNLADDATLEKETLGLYLSSHPMDKYFFKPWNDYPNQIPTALIGGVIEDITTINDKKGRRMAFVKVDTKDGIRECVAFSTQYVKFLHLLTKGKQVMIKGKKDNDKLLINTISELS